MRLAHGRSTVVGRAQIAATVVNPLPATVGMAVISPYEDQGGTRNAAELRSRSFLLQGRKGRLCPTQSRNFTMYDGSEMVRTKDRVTLSVKPEPPRPLTRELPPADPFPIDALGPLLRDAVQAIHDKLQAPLAIGGWHRHACGSRSCRCPTPDRANETCFEFSHHYCGIRRTQERL